jgi:hypothetical protein
MSFHIMPGDDCHPEFAGGMMSMPLISTRFAGRFIGIDVVKCLPHCLNVVTDEDGAQRAVGDRFTPRRR